MNNYLITNSYTFFSDYPIKRLVIYQSGLLQLVFLIVTFCTQNGFGQDTDTLQVDELKYTTKKEVVEKKKEKKSLKRFFKEGYPSPKKAAILAVVPGMGQIYNKKYWKLPLVYGALGGLIYAIRYNTNNYRQSVLSIAIKDNEVTGTDPFPSTPRNAVLAARNSFDKNRQLSWIGLIGFYLISAGDAMVDAHLKDFSVDDDISIGPILETNYAHQPVVGVGIRVAISR